MSTDSPEAIQQDFPGWRVFRGIDRAGTPKSWVASRRDPAVGVDRTVIQDTPEQLRRALADQRRKAEQSTFPLDLMARDL